MYDFTHHRPKDIAEAKSLYDRSEDGAYLSGGMTLLPTMKQRLAQPSDLVDLGALGNSGIEISANSVTIKAGTCHADVAASAELKKANPVLAYLADGIGDPQVRNRGTIGGSIANNDPAADYPAACLGLNAVITTDAREIAADDFFKGLFETALEDGEIITSVTFSNPKKAAYAKFPNPASRYALVGVLVAVLDDGVRVAVTGAGPVVFRMPEMEAALTEDFSVQAIEGIAVSADELNSDMHADADYRAHLIGIMAKRAVKAVSSK